MKVLKRILVISLTILMLVSTTCFADDTYFVPEGLGTMHTYTHWNKIKWSYTQKTLKDDLNSKSLISDSYGIVRYGDTFAGATTSTFGTIGDVLIVVQEDGVIYPVTIADEKSQKYCAWDKNPANMWGHYNGKCIVEFEILSYCAKSLYKGSGSYISPEINKPIYKIINIGNYFDNNSLITQEVIINKIKEHGMSGYMLLVNPYGGIIV